MRLQHTIIWRNKFKLLGLMLFGYILYRTDLEEILNALQNVSWPVYFAVFFISVPTIFLKALRWKLLIPHGEHAVVKTLDAWRLYWIAIFWGAVTPGKVGELFKVKYLINRGITAGEAAAATLIDRIMDMILLLLLVYAGIVFYSTGFTNDVFLFSLILAAGLLLLIILYFLRKHVQIVFLILTKKLLARSKAEKIGLETKNMFHAVSRYPAKLWFTGFAITLATWLLFVFQRYVVALSMGLEIDLIYYSITMFIMAFVTLIPVSIEGIGTRDAVLIYMLGDAGIDSAQAIALSALILIIMLFNTLVGYLIFTFSKNSSKKQQ